MYVAPVIRATPGDWVVDIDADDATAMIYVDRRGEHGHTHQVIADGLMVELDRDGEGDDETVTIVREVDHTAAYNLALLANAKRVVEKAIDALQVGFELRDKLAAPSIVVTTTDGTELARGDVLGPLEDALRELDRVVDESTTIDWLP